MKAQLCVGKPTQEHFYFYLFINFIRHKTIRVIRVTNLYYIQIENTLVVYKT